MRRVGFLTPKGDLAAAEAMVSAGRAIGIDIALTTPEALREDDPYDYIVCASPTLRKTTSHPTFLAVDRDTACYVGDDETWSNVRAFDGYLCLSDGPSRHFRHIAASNGKYVVEPGRFLDTLPKSASHADPVAAAARGDLAIWHSGTGADRRAQRLLDRLALAPFMRIAGESASSGDLRRSGAGLVLPSEIDALEGVVTNALFAVVAVGAVAVCPNLAWIRQAFGSSVFYFDPHASADVVAGRLGEIFEAIRADPEAAARMAQAARAVFEDRFELTRMVAGADAFFERWIEARRVLAADYQDVAIDVIIRTGGRPIAYLRRAIASIERQSAGRFRLIVVKYAPVDIAGAVDPHAPRIAEVLQIDAIGGNRSQTLAAGLDQVRSGLFAILDDDDYLLSDHVLGLLAALDRGGAEDVFAYGDILRNIETDLGAQDYGSVRTLMKAGEACGDIYQLLDRFSSHCFLATSRTLRRLPYAHWRSETAEDVLLIMGLLRYAAPVHVAGATCVYSQGRSDNSNFLTHPNRAEDELALTLELGEHVGALERKFPAAAKPQRELINRALRKALEVRREAIQRAGNAALGRWAQIDAARFEARSQSERREAHGALFDAGERVFVDVPLTRDRIGGHGLIDSAKSSELRVTPREAWELTAIVAIGDYAVDGCTTYAVLSVDGAREPLVAGLTDAAGELVRELAIPGGDRIIEAGVVGPSEAPMAGVALQSTATPADHSLRIREVTIGYRVAELMQSPDAAGVRDIASAQAYVDGLAHRQVIGAPARRPQGRSVALDASHVRRRHPGEGAAEGAPLTALTGAAPWDYFAQIHLPAEAVAGARWLKVSLGRIEEPFLTMIVDAAFAAQLSDRATVRSGKTATELWFDLTALQGEANLVFQCEDAPQDRAVTIVAIELFA